MFLVHNKHYTHESDAEGSSETGMKRVAYPVPSPTRRACSLRAATQQLRRDARQKHRRHLRRRPLKPEVTRTVCDFEVCTDVATLCVHPRLQAFVRRAITRRIRMHAPDVLLLGKPRIRLFFLLGDVQESGDFFANVHSQFVDVLKPRLQACPGWKTQTKRFTERFDFHYRNGLTAQTLFKPQDPYLSHRIVMQKPAEALMLQLHQPCQMFPKNVCLQQVHEVKCEVPCLQTVDLHRVEVRHIHAFCHGAWIYRVIKCWKGATLNQALQARQLSPARIEISIELLHAEYPKADDVTFTIASALLKVRSFVNSSVLDPENARFDTAFVRDVSPKSPKRSGDMEHISR